MLSTSIRYPRSPQVGPHTHCVCRTGGGGPLLPGPGEGVVVQEPSAVHDTSDPHPASQVPHQFGHTVQVDKNSSASCTAAYQVQFSTWCQLFPAKQFPDNLRQYLSSKEGEFVARLGSGCSWPGVTGTIRNKNMVGVCKVRILFSVTGQNSSNSLDLRPPRKQDQKSIDAIFWRLDSFCGKIGLIYLFNRLVLIDWFNRLV